MTAPASLPTNLWGLPWERVADRWIAGRLSLTEKDGTVVVCYNYEGRQIKSQPCKTPEEALRDIFGDPVTVLGFPHYPRNPKDATFQAYTAVGMSDFIGVLTRTQDGWGAGLSARAPTPEEAYRNAFQELLGDLHRMQKKVQARIEKCQEAIRTYWPEGEV